MIDWGMILVGLCALGCAFFPVALCGGEEPNTYSLDLEASSSQCAYLSPGTEQDINGPSVTVELWIKLESTPSSGNVMMFVNNYDNGTGGYAFGLSNVTGTLYLQAWMWNAEGDVNEKVAWTPSTGTWYHVAMTATNGGSTTVTKFYVNGVQQGSDQSDGQNGDILDSGVDFCVGCRERTDSYLDGKVDDVRVWTVVRSESDLAAYKDQHLAGDEEGLLGYWKFNGDALDSTASGSHLTLANSPTYSSDVPF